MSRSFFECTGKFTYRNELVEKYLLSRKCVAFRYVDDDGEPTESYPMNPNGSKGNFRVLSMHRKKILNTSSKSNVLMYLFHSEALLNVS